MKPLALHTNVIVNTGGANSSGVIVDKKRDGKPSLHGHYWEEQDSYLVRFTNGTQQYIPAANVREGGVFESGATTHAVNDLILFTDNTRELAEYRDSIYRLYSDRPKAAKTEEFKKAFVALFLKAKEQYIKELTVYASKHIIDMSSDEVQEFCALYASDFDNWKQDNK